MVLVLALWCLDVIQGRHPLPPVLASITWQIDLYLELSTLELKKYLFFLIFILLYLQKCLIKGEEL